MNHIDLENELKNVLRRENASEGFADRVLAQIANQGSSPKAVPRNSWLDVFARPLVRWAALAAVSAGTIFGVHVHNVRRQQAEGEAAKERLILALRIAGSKLQLAKSKVNEINANQTHGDQLQEEKE